MIGLALVFTVSTVSASVLEAAAGALGVAMVLLISGVLIVGLGEAVYFTGSGWVLTTFFFVAGAAVAAVVLWLQYAKRNTLSAPVAFAAGVGAIALAGAVVPWSAVFGVQRAFSSEPARADAFVLRLAPDCFHTALIDVVGEGPGPQYTDPTYTADTALTRWEGGQRAAAGPRAIALTTAVRTEGVPEGWRAMAGQVRASFVDAAGETIATMKPRRETAVWSTAADGMPLAIHAWLMPRAQYESLAAEGVNMRLDHSVTLLRPQATFEVTADGTLRAVPGVGYCGAEANTRARRVLLNCLISQMQPALVVAAMAGAPGDDTPAGQPDYRPALLGFMTEGEHTAALPFGSERIQVATFTARAHLDRRVEATGILGGANCAPPV